MLGAPTVEKYVATFTVLPIGKPYAGTLQKEVYLQIEIDEKIGDKLSKNETVNVILNPVPLRDRIIPEVNISLKSASLHLSV
ncbi:MAG: hypothetical protein H7X94_15300 [Vallitaleaceae bacterium]|nr:hypothetical protein [Vallitaleaceae bacterium]